LKKSPWAIVPGSASECEGCDDREAIRDMKQGASTDADAIEYFKKIGFEIGTTVVATSTMVHYRIKAITCDKVEICAIAGKPVEKKMIPANEFVHGHTVLKTDEKDTGNPFGLMEVL
jgi:hypothetical protein